MPQCAPNCAVGTLNGAPNCAIGTLHGAPNCAVGTSIVRIQLQLSYVECNGASLQTQRSATMICVYSKCNAFHTLTT